MGLVEFSQNTKPKTTTLVLPHYSLATLPLGMRVCVHVYIKKLSISVIKMWLIILAQWRQKQEDKEFKGSHSYRDLIFKNQQTTGGLCLRRDA